MSENEHGAKNFKSKLDDLVIRMKATQERNKIGRTKEWEELKKRGYALGNLRSMDSVIFESMMYINESREQDDLTTLTIIAELSKYVYDLTESVTILRNLFNPELESKLDAVLPILPDLSALNEAIQRKLEAMKQEEETKKRFINNLGKNGAK